MMISLRRAAALLLAATLFLTGMPALAENTTDELTPAIAQTAAPSPEEAAAEQAEAADASADAADTSAESETADVTESTDATTESAADVKYVATASVALKVRRGPGEEYNGADSIPKDSFVYILQLGDTWCKVRTSRVDGWVKTQYLEDIREYDPATATFGEKVSESTIFTAASKVTDGFAALYKAHAVRNKASIYEQADERSRRLGGVNIYDEVRVGAIEGEWCYVSYGRIIGYMRTDHLFKWDRIDPYAGDIPGLVVYPLMVFVKRTTDILSTKDNSVLRTINPGSAVCTLEPDENGRYVLPYWRETGYIMQDDVAYVVPVVDWEDAQSGDLISVMTTYFAVGKSTLQYQGRNWNIYLSSSMITGTVLQPGDTFNMNETIGPYRKSTGYKSAPIMSPNALTGYGGGTCQVNTTFYVTNIAVPILITHRRVHAEVGIYYVPKGFDAAVGGGNINLTLENTLPYAIRYQFFISDGVLTCCIYRS